jgi:hypothetical protein
MNSNRQVKRQEPLSYHTERLFKDKGGTVQTITTPTPRPSTVRAVIEWRDGLRNPPVIYTIADTAEQGEAIEKLLSAKLGEHGDA